MPGALAALRDLGVDPAGHPITGIRYCAGGRRGRGRLPGRRRAAASAARRCTPRCATPSPRPGVDGRAGQGRRGDARTTTASSVDGVRARYLVAADGLHSPLRRSLGLDRARAAAAPRYGLRRHYALAPWTDRVEVHWARDAEAYVTPVGDDLVGVAVLSLDPRRRSTTTSPPSPRCCERLAGAGPASDVRGAGPLRQSRAASYGGAGAARRRRRRLRRRADRRGRRAGARPGAGGRRAAIAADDPDGYEAGVAARRPGATAG